MDTGTIQIYTKPMQMLEDRNQVGKVSLYGSHHRWWGQDWLATPRNYLLQLTQCFQRRCEISVHGMQHVRNSQQAAHKLVTENICKALKEQLWNKPHLQMIGNSNCQLKTHSYKILSQPQETLRPPGNKKCLVTGQSWYISRCRQNLNFRRHRISTIPPRSGNSN